MKPTFKLFRRGTVFYSEVIATGKRRSLKTSNRREADQILAAQNAAHGNAALQFKMAEAFLSTVDSRLTARTWENVIREFSEHGGREYRRTEEKSFQESRLRRPRGEKDSGDHPRRLFPRDATSDHRSNRLHEATPELRSRPRVSSPASSSLEEIPPTTPQANQKSHHLGGTQDVLRRGAE